MIVLFIMGTVMASFLYVITNLKEIKIEVLRNRSKCDYCREKLPYYTLIPVVSYLLLKGRCKFCHFKIPSENILIEILLGVIYILPLFNFIENELLLYYYLLSTILVPLAFVDIKKFIIPNHMLIILMISGILLFSFELKTFIFKILIIILVIIIYPLISKFIGFGDVKLFSIILLLLPIKLFIMITLLTFIIGGITVIIFENIFKDKSKKYPLVPFITIATLITFLTSQDLNYLYGGIL